MCTTAVKFIGCRDLDENPSFRDENFPGEVVMIGKWKIRCLLILLSLFSLLLLSACNGSGGNAANGERWFSMHNCSACHGKAGNDGRAAAIAGTDMGFGSFVRFLRDPDSPSMPAFPESKLSKNDAADIYAWLKSLPE